MNLMEVVTEYFKYYKEKVHSNLPCSIDILTYYSEKYPMVIFPNFRKNRQYCNWKTGDICE